MAKSACVCPDSSSSHDNSCPSGIFRTETTIEGLRGLVWVAPEGDVLDQHGLAGAVGFEHDDLSAFAGKVERDGAFELGSVDLLGPVPVEVGNGLESAEPAAD